ncbi:MAG: aminotransferase class V-fold PLP-dependent enzyme, partial [Actinobacteria bacterium]|nr:aminotransferase class V-fold PLP-dependent enzyme [Actinomycetota bacterium]
RAPGWRSVADPWAIDGDRIDLAPDARRLEVSSISYPARFALGAAIDVVLEMGVERALEHALALGASLAERLRSLGAEVATPDEPGRRAGIVSCRFPGREPADVVERLRDAGVVVSARGGFVRWSAHVYNDGDDVAGRRRRRAAGGDRTLVVLTSRNEVGSFSEVGIRIEVMQFDNDSSSFADSVEKPWISLRGISASPASTASRAGTSTSTTPRARLPSRPWRTRSRSSSPGTRASTADTATGRSSPWTGSRRLGSRLRASSTRVTTTSSSSSRTRRTRRTS